MGIEKQINRFEIRITGRVQGVGARPFFYRLARRHALTGFVRNDPVGVILQVQGLTERVEDFIESLSDPVLSSDWPPLLKIEKLDTQLLPTAPQEHAFQIAPSRGEGMPVCQVTPDTAVCTDCLDEMNDPEDFRYRYPFINCTQCGPRYTIVKQVPYDRANTTMSVFPMCDQCRAQYEEVSDRRFHAQPVACPKCGPKIWLTDPDGHTLANQTDQAIAAAARMLRKGRILAIKGIGGFHLAVDAFNEQAVCDLRRRKQRRSKPFALMARSLEIIRSIALLTPQAESILTGPEAPIVLLGKRTGNPVAPSAAAGTDTFGVMLPYAPLHHLLFAEEGMELLVMTSANFSEEPLISDNQQALDELSEAADGFLLHDRDIFRQIDDSVVHLVHGKTSPLRRGRGYVPTPIFRSQPACLEIFAAGPDLKNTFCFVKDDQYLLSEHIGDLAEGRSYRHYLRSIEHLRKLFEVQPQVIACDLHPGYLSTQYALSIPAREHIQIQHHWAHIASVLAEYQCPSDEQVIGLVADGTGYGTDGAVWGCECLIASLADFTRAGHLDYYPLAGGDTASKQAIRPLIGLMDQEDLERFHSILGLIEPDKQKIKMVRLQIEKGINTVPTSSLGRLFDAAAALSGMGTENRFEAELPMALQAAIRPGMDDAYPVDFRSKSDQTFLWDGRRIIREIAEDVQKGTKTGIIAARFHNAVAEALLQFAIQARQRTGIEKTALSGGVFCNRYLAERLIYFLQKEGFTVLWKQTVPVNDGGIALGQAAIAASKTQI